MTDEAFPCTTEGWSSLKSKMKEFFEEQSSKNDEYGGVIPVPKPYYDHLKKEGLCPSNYIPISSLHGFGIPVKLPSNDRILDYLEWQLPRNPSESNKGK